MSKPRRSRIVVVILVLISMAGFSLRSAIVARAADKTQKGEKRTADQVIAELQTTGKQLKDVLESSDVLLDPQKRQEIAPKVIPPMKKLVALFDELASVEPTAKGSAMAAQRQLLAMLAVMGDNDLMATLQKRANGKESAQWKGTLLLGRWGQADKEAHAQAKILDELEELAKANNK